MNRRQLDALLAAGLITAAAHATALAPGAPAPTLRVEIPAQSIRLAEPPAEADPENPEQESQGAREIIAVIAKYGTVVESHNLVLDAGCLEPRDIAARRVKVLRDHNHSDPLGYLTALDLANLESTLYIVEGENGDRALAEAANGLRDGVSVGFQILEYSFDENDVLHVIRAELYEVSLCAIPAIADAGVITVNASANQTPTPKGTLMNREQLALALAEGRITQTEHDAALSILDGRQSGPAGQAAPAELAAGPQTVELGNGPLEISDRPASLAQVSREIAELAQKRDMNGIMLALNTHVVADDPGKAFYGRADWIGEAWQAQPEGRPWVDSFGTPKPLTGGKIEGFQWDERIAPKKYSGGGAEVPTGKAKTKPVEAEPERWAFGTTVDRIFTDLGTENLVASLFGLLTAGYQQESDFDVASKVLAAATIPTGPDGADPGTDPDPIIDTSVLNALKHGARDLRRLGARVDTIWLADDLFDEWSDLKIADLPAWIANALGFVDLREGTSVIGDLEIKADSKLDDGELVMYDKRAVTVYETNAIQLEMIAVANGRLDLGWYNYGGLLVNDARAIQRRTVA